MLLHGIVQCQVDVYKVFLISFIIYIIPMFLYNIEKQVVSLQVKAIHNTTCYRAE